MNYYEYSTTDKKLFDELGLDTFVLGHRQAGQYLKYLCDMFVNQGLNNEIDSECAGEMVRDCIDMARVIAENDWEFVKFYECPMAACNLGICEMVEKPVEN